MNRKLNSRQSEIYEKILRDGEVKISQLKEEFNVVEMTIRRDLEKLEKQGLVVRTFGGAIKSTGRDIAINEREKILRDAKSRIGYRAAKSVQYHEAIFIDSGTTASYIAKFLEPSEELTVVTNGLNIAADLAGTKIQKIVVGGELRDATLSMVGPIAQEALSRMSFDRVFIATTGLTIEQGLSNSNVYEAQIKNIVIKQAKEVNVVLDHSKFGVQSLSTFASLDDIDNIYTDKIPNEDYLAVLKEKNIQLIVCE